MPKRTFVKGVFPAPMQKPFGFAQDKPLTPEQFEKFLTLATALSPENLSCDGELPQAEIRRKVKKLSREWMAAEREMGRKVTEDEIWDRVMKEGEAATQERGGTR